MKADIHLLGLSTARFYTPLLFLLSAALLASGVAGSGVGFIAGLAAALALVLHLLVFGVRAAQTAFPAWLARLMLALGLVIACAAQTGAWRFSSRVAEGGLFIAVVAGAALILPSVFGRAPTLRDAE
jgi:multisubunit Na+/H+ antiporter MnhB subunit